MTSRAISLLLPLGLTLGVTRLGLCTDPGRESQEPAQGARRLEMVRTQIASRGISDTLVLRAMGRVQRHLFVPPEMAGAAYGDHPLPIGYRQTISQPYIVALMTELLHARAGMRVLEIGTGSGYQAAVLAEIVDTVYTIEIVRELAVSARERLTRLGYGNVVVRAGDGYQGWPEEAPFDAIIVTAAVDHLPRPLLDQLAEGGRLVLPQGEPYGVQSLKLVRKQAGGIAAEEILPVRFVPLTRDP
jgi:protein-L-isoaspartate(D-aspartate) O-methyltransferase